MRYMLILIMATMFVGCQSSGKYQGQVGPATKWGTVIGGGIGGVLGHQKSGRTAEGAGIGAVAGAGIGYVIDTISGNKPEPKPQQPVYTEPRDTVTIRRRKTIYVDEQVPVQREVKEYYIDPNTGRRVYIRK